MKAWHTALAAAVASLAQAEGAHIQDTQSVRVVEQSDNGVNVTRAEDELLVAAQQRGTDRHNPISATLGVAPRSSAWRFTVGRTVEVSAVLLDVDMDGVGYGSFWVGIFEGDADKPTAHLVTLGRWHAEKVGIATLTQCYLGLPTDVVVTLSAGAYYWLAVCAVDPDPGVSTPDADQWNGSPLWLRKLIDAEVTGVLVKDAVGNPSPPYGVGDYESFTGHHPWFKLIVRQIIYDVPIAPQTRVPSSGELAVMERVEGSHARRQISGGQAWQASGGVWQKDSSAGGGGGGSSLHKLADQSGLGQLHTVSGLEDGMVLQGTDPNAAAFGYLSPTKLSEAAVGALIYGGAGPAWAVLPHPGAANYGLVTTGADTLGWSNAPIFANITDSGLTATGVVYAGVAGLLSTKVATFLFDAAADLLTVKNLATQAGGSVTIPTLTATRVVFAGVGGLLSDDAGMTYAAATDTLTVGGLVDTGAASFVAGAAGQFIIARTAGSPQKLDLWSDATAGYFVIRNDPANDNKDAVLAFVTTSATRDMYFAYGGTAAANYQLALRDGVLYPYLDNDVDFGTSAKGIKAFFFSDANTTDPATAGEVRFDDDTQTLKYHDGGVAVSVGGRIAVSSTVDSHLFTGLDTYDHPTYTIPAATLTVNKGIHIRIFGTGVATGAASGPVSTLTYTLYVGTEPVASFARSGPGTAGGSTKIAWEFDVLMLVNSVGAGTDTCELKVRTKVASDTVAFAKTTHVAIIESTPLVNEAYDIATNAAVPVYVRAVLTALVGAATTTQRGALLTIEDG